MPIKRRVDKARKLDTMRLHELHYGPGECLFSGEGYMGDHPQVLWRDVPDTGRAGILAEMREDWQRHSAQVLASWAERTEHDLWCARRHYGDPSEPWALREFGAP